MRPASVEGAASWSPGQSPAESRAHGPWIPCALLLALAACYQAAVLRLAATSGAHHPFGDFVAIWSYARIAVEHPITLLYDWDGLRESQAALGMDPALEAPFAYPPTFLLVIWPLGFLPFHLALPAWLAGTFALFAAAVLGGRRFSPLPFLALLLAPAATTTIAMGQGGFLVGALLVGGLRLADRHPVWGGVLLGLLTCKPQLGILVPFALLAAGQWRCIAAACATAMLLAVAAGVLLGWSAWSAWIEVLPRYQRWFDALEKAWEVQPTVLANLQQLGAPTWLAKLAQAAAACCAAACTWSAFRAGPRGLAVPVLLVATFLAAPHAFTYDLPLVSAAATLFALHRLRSEGGLGPGDRVAVLLAFCLPALMLAPALLVRPGLPLPISTPVLALVLAAFLRPALREGIGAAPPVAVPSR